MGTSNEDHFDPPQTDRPRQRPKASARLAARVIVDRLAWCDFPLVYFDTGAVSPPEAATGELPASPLDQELPTTALRRKLHRRDPGAYALSTSVSDALLRIDDGLFARALRRLSDAARFPRALPPLVGDPTAWRARAETALRRARVAATACAADATAPDRLLIESVCLWIGPDDQRPSRSCKRLPPRISADPDSFPADLYLELASTLAGQRSVRFPGTGHRAWYACGASLSDWPVDVLIAAARRCGGADVLATWAARHPVANDAAVADTMRDWLLTSPYDAAATLPAMDALVELRHLWEQLAAEPPRRARLLADAQRRIVRRATTRSGAHGSVLFRPTDADLLPRTAFYQFYREEIGEAASAFAKETGLDVAAANTLIPASDTSNPFRPKRQLADLRSVLSARPLCFLFLGHPELIGQTPVHVHHLKTGKPPYATFATSNGPLTFESLGDAAALLLYQAAERLDCRTLRLPFLSHLLRSGLAAHAAPLRAWVAAVCRIWPPGPTGTAHVRAAAAAMFTVVRECAGDPKLTRTAIDALAEIGHVLLSNAADHPVHANAGRYRRRPAVYAKGRDDLAAMVRTLCRSLARGARAQDLAPLFAHAPANLLPTVLEQNPSAVHPFVKWIRDEILRDAAPDQVAERLAGWGLTDRWLGACWATVSGLLGPRFTTRLARLVGSIATEATPSARTEIAGALLYPAAPEAADARTAPAEARAAAAAFIASTVAVLECRLARSKRRPIEHVVPMLERAVATAWAAAKLGHADAPALVDRILDAMAERTPPTSRASAEFYADYEDRFLSILVSISLGRAERIVAIGFAITEADYPLVEEVDSAWRWLGATCPDLRERLSAAAARPELTTPVLAALARLNTALRLQQREELAAALIGLTRPSATEPAAAIEVEHHLPAPVASDLRTLRHLLAPGPLPDSVLRALSHADDLRRELQALERRADVPRSVSLRMDNLRRYLSDRDGLARHVSRELKKHVPPALDRALLKRLDETTDAVLRHHFSATLGRDVPAGPASRDWDNALRMYLMIDGNRKLLRRLLVGELTGDRSWIARHPDNVRFVARARTRGIDTDAWLAPMSEDFHPSTLWSSAPPPAHEPPLFRIELETRPLHVLQMGNYFDTCLGRGGLNAFSTVANACEINKRVVYVRNPAGAVVGRKLLVLNCRGQLVGFFSYGTGPAERWEDADRGGGTVWLKIALDRFCHRLADRIHATLYAIPQDRLEDTDLALFAKWYNDGAEPFDACWHQPSIDVWRNDVLTSEASRRRLLEPLSTRYDCDRSEAFRALVILGPAALEMVQSAPHLSGYDTILWALRRHVAPATTPGATPPPAQTVTARKSAPRRRPTSPAALRS